MHTTGRITANNVNRFQFARRRRGERRQSAARPAARGRRRVRPVCARPFVPSGRSAAGPPFPRCRDERAALTDTGALTPTAPRRRRPRTATSTLRYAPHPPQNLERTAPLLFSHTPPALFPSRPLFFAWSPRRASDRSVAPNVRCVLRFFPNL